MRFASSFLQHHRAMWIMGINTFYLQLPQINRWHRTLIKSQPKFFAKWSCKWTFHVCTFLIVFEILLFYFFVTLVLQILNTIIWFEIPGTHLIFLFHIPRNSRWSHTICWFCQVNDLVERNVCPFDMWKCGIET